MANPNPILHLEFLKMAEQFFRAYRMLQARPILPIDWAAYFNFCHSIEVGMKAYLIFKGMDSKDVRDNFGHRLKPLMEECERRGLAFDLLSKRCIDALTGPHASHWARYPKEDWSDGGVPTVEQFERGAVNLLNDISECLQGPKLF